MHCSTAKCVMDAEQSAMAYRMSEGPKLDGLDEAVGDVGPAEHFLGHPHTQEKFQTTYFMPDLLDNNSVEQWTAEG